MPEPYPYSDSDDLGDAIGHAVGLAIAHAYFDSFAYPDPFARDDAVTRADHDAQSVAGTHLYSDACPLCVADAQPERDA